MEESNQSTDFDEIAEKAQALEAKLFPGSVPKSPQESEQMGPPTAEIIYPVIALACDIAAPNWRVTESEKKSLADAYGALLDKYFPDGMMAWGAELNALLITAAVIAPRMRTPRKEEEPRETPKKNEEAV